MSGELFTLAAPQRHEREIRKSRFVAVAAPIADVAGAQAFIDASADASASTNAWAWRVGDDYRCHDDGEPGGSAGRPILAAIDGRELDRVAVLVMRWFGGIKLGIGGLVRAFGGTAAECLRQATRIPLVDESTVAVDCEARLVALIGARAAELGASVEDSAFAGDHARLRLRLPSAQVAALDRLLRDLSRGRSRAKPLD